VADTIGTIMIELLALVRRRVPLSKTDVAAATGVTEEKAAAWIERRTEPTRTAAVRVAS
jgi:DNA-binding transcriptional regulator YiaG